MGKALYTVKWIHWGTHILPRCCHQVLTTCPACVRDLSLRWSWQPVQRKEKKLLKAKTILSKGHDPANADPIRDPPMENPDQLLKGPKHNNPFGGPINSRMGPLGLKATRPKTTCSSHSSEDLSAISNLFASLTWAVRLQIPR